jgi:hypothetical protein
MDVKRTEGEVLFEQYLATQQLAFEFEKEHAGKSKKPDYAIEWKSRPVLLDVKDFESWVVPPPTILLNRSIACE